MQLIYVNYFDLYFYMAIFVKISKIKLYEIKNFKLHRIYYYHRRILLLRRRR